MFYTRTPWKRVIVMFAGPFMNLVLAVALFLTVLMGFGITAADHHGQLRLPVRHRAEREPRQVREGRSGQPRPPLPV